MTKKTIVILEVSDDVPYRNWWEAMGLPAPERWGGEVGVDHHVLVKIVLDKVLA